MTDINKILDVKPNIIKPSQGKVLVAEPFVGDYYFKRSVILLAEHNEEGSYGMIFNKPLYVKLNELITDFPKFDADLFLGGPVKTDSLFYIHKFQEVDNSIKISEDLYWGGNLDNIKELIALNKLNKENIRFFIGYSGWSPKQLDTELRENSWVVTRTKSDILLNEPPNDIWKRIVLGLGEDYAHWINFPINPDWN